MAAPVLQTRPASHNFSDWILRGNGESGPKHGSTNDRSNGLRDRRLDGGLHDRGNNSGDEVKRTCAHCGKEYTGALHGRYHSSGCKKAAYRARKKYGNAQTSKQLRTCARCGVQFEGALHGRYHSGACKQAAYRERKQRTVKP